MNIIVIFLGEASLIFKLCFLNANHHHHHSLRGFPKEFIGGGGGVRQQPFSNQQNCWPPGVGLSHRLSKMPGKKHVHKLFQFFFSQRRVELSPNLEAKWSFIWNATLTAWKWKGWTNSQSDILAKKGVFLIAGGGREIISKIFICRQVIYPGFAQNIFPFSKFCVLLV